MWDMNCSKQTKQKKTNRKKHKGLCYSTGLTAISDQQKQIK